jgi:hypothetical protein
MNEELFWSSMTYAMREKDPLRWLEGYRFALCDGTRNFEPYLEIVYFLQACLKERAKERANV